MITSSIVIYKTDKDELRRIIQCASDSPINIIYIIDNSPTNELGEFVVTLSTKIIYKFNNANIGYGSAHNIGLKESLKIGAKYHIVLNPDIYFKKDTIDTLTYFMNINDDIGAIMPLVKYPDGNIQYLCKLQPTPFDLIGRRFLPEKLILKRNVKYELKQSGYNKIINAPCLSGCFMFLRTSILKDVGFFDEKFFMYCEDFDFYRRIHAKYKTIFYPYVSIVHEHKKESYQNKKLLKFHIKSAIYYFNKWGWFFDKDRKKINKVVLKEIEK